MKTIVVANQKGGVGKTTLARHLAFYAHEKGLRTLAVDMDVQGNFSTTFKIMAKEAGIEPPTSKVLVASSLFSSGAAGKPQLCTPDGRLAFVDADPGIVQVERRGLEQVIRSGQARFSELASQYDVCVMDTGPAVSNLLVVALAVADFAVSPCKPDRDALAGLGAFFGNVVRVRDETGLNPKLAPLGVLPNQVDKKRAYHRDVLADMRQAWGENVLPVTLFERAAIDIAKDRPVWRTDRGESRSVAAKEMKTVCAHIFKRMGF